jgi:hypothetical protein
MTAPFLVPCLVQLRDQFNHEFPDRAKGADGWIGDNAHATREPDLGPQPEHQGPGPGHRHHDRPEAAGHLDCGTCARCCAARQPARVHHPHAEDRLEVARLDLADVLPAPRTRTPTTPTSRPAHDGTGYNDKSPWGLEELMTKAEFTAWMDEYFAVTKQADGTSTSKIGRDALNQGVPNVFTGAKSSMWALTGDIAEHVKALELKLASDHPEGVTAPQVPELGKIVQRSPSPTSTVSSGKAVRTPWSYACARSADQADRILAEHEDGPAASGRRRRDRARRRPRGPAPYSPK